jgi:cell division protein FtsI/penicillin-binding protein 2
MRALVAAADRDPTCAALDTAREDGSVRLRDLLAVLVGLAVVGGVAWGGWTYLSEETEPTVEEAEPGADAVATARAYLDAWAAGDHQAMADHVRQPPEDFIAVHDQLRDGLEPQDLEVVAPGLDDVDRDTAEEAGELDVDATVTTTVADIAEPISWDVSLRLLRERGQWGVEWTRSSVHPELRPGWRFGRESEPIERYAILAADGTPLAGSGDQVIFGFEPTAVDDPDAVIAAFEEAIPGSESAAARELGRNDLVDGWFYPVATVSQAVADEAAPVLRQVSGVLRRGAEGRVLYDQEFAYHLVGVVSEATAEQLEELGDPYEPGDEVGQFGLERVFEEQLVGDEIQRVGLIDGEDGPMRIVLGEGQPEGSGPVETTIDIVVQRAVERSLQGVEEPAAVVVVEGATGAIRGSASRPLSGYNRAFAGRYPPGSTFKVVTAEALLAQGANVDDEVACPAETRVGGLRVPNAGDKDLGTTTLLTAFAESCNTSFATLAADLGGEALTDAAGRFGFGVEPLTPLDAFGGSFPDPVDTAEVGAAAFGQGRVEASPLHLATVAAAAWDGTWRQPFLLEDDGPGESRPLATGAVDGLRPMLLATVEEGTGDTAAVAGEEVGGKTGTAQAPDGVEHAWFVGTWEGYGFAVLVEDGGAGGQTAGPIAGRLVQELAALSELRAADEDADDGDGTEDVDEADADADGGPDGDGADDGANDGVADDDPDDDAPDGGTPDDGTPDDDGADDGAADDESEADGGDVPVGDDPVDGDDDG